MKPREYRYLCCDFETTVYDGQTETEVWSAASVELGTEEVHVQGSIAHYFSFLFRQRGNLICYFHNLKFDGSFLLDYLLRNGWEFNRVSEKEMRKRQFKCAISDRGAWYTIILKQNDRFIEFRDSLKLLPFSLKKIGKAFQTKHQKLEMAYEGYRYANCPITEKELEYIKNDVLVLKEALEYCFFEGHKKLTIGSCCLDEFKKGFDKEEYKELFPDLTKFELEEEIYGAKNADAYIRKSYRGGWCYLKKGMENKRIHGGYTADINSSYPSNMSTESGNYYPIGLPKFFRGKPPEGIERFYYFIRFRCRFKLKAGKLPTVQIKNSFLYSGTEYLETSSIYDKTSHTYRRYYVKDGKKHSTMVTITMTMTDFELFQEHYHVYGLEYLDGCYFYQQIGLFDEYMYRYKERKENSMGARRELAKLYLNNLYGKFASNDLSSYKVPFLEEKMVTFKFMKDGKEVKEQIKQKVLNFHIIEEHDKKPGYIPIGSAITSYAREFVIRHAQANYEDFIYADTDSIHCKGDPDKVKMIKVHPTKFCHWKLESYWDLGIFVRQKTYLEHVTHNDGKPVDPYYNIKCAGMSDAAKKEFLEEHDITEFKEGLKLKNSLKPHRIKGGVLLTNDGYHMTKKRGR